MFDYSIYGIKAFKIPFEISVDSTGVWDVTAPPPGLILIQIIMNHFHYTDTRFGVFKDTKVCFLNARAAVKAPGTRAREGSDAARGWR